MTALNVRLVEPLAPHRARIAGCADRQSVPFIESTWRRWLHVGNIDRDVVEHLFTSIGPGLIAREQLRKMALQTATTDDRLALLVAVLVWGRGKSNARMRDAILKTLTHDGRDEVLANTAELAQAGRVAEAYQAWQLPGLQAAFFTKWLWAATASAPDSCCLVLDLLVWKSLRTFGWNSREAAGGNRSRALRYAAYVEDVHVCATQLDVRAEDIECALFRMKGNPERLETL
ncbi:hypothetical protein [Mycolicibacterium neoaurum]|uniref:8-oxoguanine DNA glycosylase OGG fold protein n=1 Tax=Mycolicibacterium neoaurum TaxID=1795 RepID=UPI001F4C722A|nr:hypothetical protein [Mycolicibacterium neoaurum]